MVGLWQSEMASPPHGANGSEGKRPCSKRGLERSNELSSTDSICENGRVLNILLRVFRDCSYGIWPCYLMR